MPPENDDDALLDRWGRWENLSVPVRPKVVAPPPALDLCQCPKGCANKLCYPMSWRESGGAWELTIRCPECDWQNTGVYSQRLVDRYDHDLNVGTDRLLGDLELLSERVKQDEVALFRLALEADAILPSDFGEQP